MSETLDTYLMEELKATTAEEYAIKKAAMQALTVSLREQLPGISSLEALLHRCREVQESSGLNRPAWLGAGNTALNPNQIAVMRSLGYPDDFLGWMEQHGDLYLDLAGIRIVNGGRVWDELNGSWHGLLKPNGFLFLTSDGSGNAYFWDSRSPEPRIRFADHDAVYGRLDSLEELYSEHYDFWAEEDGTFHNPQGLNPDLILDADGEPRLDSPYVRSYLEESLEVLPVQDFLGLVRYKFDLGLSYLHDRY